MKDYFKNLGALFLLLVSLSQVMSADDVTETIEEALEAYKEGEYTEAIESLTYASQVIGQKKGEQLTAFLPEPLDGWDVKDKKKSSGSTVFGGGSSSERTYRKESSYVTVTIAADSPAMQSMMMIFTNPMFAASGGGKMEKIKRQKAIVIYDEIKKKGDIKIVVKKRFFVSIEGRGVTKEELVDFAKEIDYKKLSKLP